MIRYDVIVKTTKMPSSVKDGNYRKIALVGHVGCRPVKNIDIRHKHIISITDCYYRIYVGRTDKSYGVRLINILQKKADGLNNYWGTLAEMNRQ